MKRPTLLVAAAAFAACLTQAALAAPAPSPAPASPSPAPKASATPAPPKETDEKRVGISGVWEVQIQQDSGTVYTHFKLDQVGTALTGQYLDTTGKKYPLQGTFDQKTADIVVSLPGGESLHFTGTVDGTSDMAGTLETAKSMVGFTAAYRPKYKWIDNLSPNPMGGGGTPYGTPNGTP